MKYYFNKTVNSEFDQVMNRVKKELEVEGFGVLTEINVNDF